MSLTFDETPRPVKFPAVQEILYGRLNEDWPEIETYDYVLKKDRASEMTQEEFTSLFWRIIEEQIQKKMPDNGLLKSAISEIDTIFVTYPKTVDAYWNSISSDLDIRCHPIKTTFEDSEAFFIRFRDLLNTALSS